MLTKTSRMRIVGRIAGFALLAFACEGNGGEARTGITGATLSTLAKQLGQSAGNDLANEIVTRITLSKDPKLQALMRAMRVQNYCGGNAWKRWPLLPQKDQGDHFLLFKNPVKFTTDLRLFWNGESN